MVHNTKFKINSVFALLLAIVLLLPDARVFALPYKRMPADTALLHQKKMQVHGYVSVSGLVQTGNEQRIVASLLSDINLSETTYAIEPLTSVAYSSKPGKQVEGEYLENVILRYGQSHRFYPALGVALEKSFLRKISYRESIAAAMVWNAINETGELVRLAIGYSYEYARYNNDAFSSAGLSTNYRFARNLNQVYTRLKGKNSFIDNKLLLSYDFFYQPAIHNLSDYRWTLIANIDIPLSKQLAIRSSAVSTYEDFVAPGVYKNNFRLTYGINISF